MSLRSLRSILSQAKFIDTIRRTPGAIETHLSLKFFCTQTTQNEDSLCKRIEKLPKGESIGSAFRSWMRDGFPVRGADIFHTINRLRKLNFNKRALEVNSNSLLYSLYFVSSIYFCFNEYSHHCVFCVQFHCLRLGLHLDWLMNSLLFI